MSARRCTKHPQAGPHDRSHGECRRCRVARQERYRRSCVEARHKLRALEAVLAS